ncbi:hypothetical protein G6F68_018084 [Rhizopus microsporus]|nr:hypothetical protein G6F68_018084 [Rhizopus microsporus]
MEGGTQHRGRGALVVEAETAAIVADTADASAVARPARRAGWPTACASRRSGSVPDAAARGSGPIPAARRSPGHCRPVARSNRAWRGPRAGDTAARRPARGARAGRVADADAWRRSRCSRN